MRTWGEWFQHVRKADELKRKLQEALIAEGNVLPWMFCSYRLWNGKIIKMIVQTRGKIRRSGTKFQWYRKDD